MNIIAMMLPPVLGGIIALSTNWIAIKMLFRPHTEKRLFGFRLPFTPGLIPKERQRLARKLGEAISAHLLTPDVLADKLADPTVWPLPDYTVKQLFENKGIIDPAAYIEAKVTDFVGNQLNQPIKNAAELLLPKAVEGFVNFPEHFPEIDAKLAELTEKIINESISKFAGLFIKKEKVYANIKEVVFEYLSNPENQEDMLEKIHGFVDNLKDVEINDVKGDLMEAQGQPPSRMLRPLINHILNFHIRNDMQGFIQKEPYATMIKKALSSAAEYLATHMPVADMIEHKMGGLDVGETEKVILGVVGRELRLIIWLGGLFGFLIGLMSLVMQLT